MKQISLMLFFCLFCQTSFCTDINPEDLHQIDQLLENILRETNALPQKNKMRIISSVRDIQRLIDQEASENVERRPFERMERPVYDQPKLKLYNDKGINDLRTRIKASWPYRDQLVLINQINKTSAFTIRQILEIIKEISFPNNQKEVALILIPNAVDAENIDLLYELFWSIADKDKINKMADDNLRRRE